SGARAAITAELGAVFAEPCRRAQGSQTPGGVATGRRPRRTGARRPGWPPSDVSKTIETLDAGVGRVKSRRGSRPIPPARRFRLQRGQNCSSLSLLADTPTTEAKGLGSAARPLTVAIVGSGPAG